MKYEETRQHKDFPERTEAEETETNDSKTLVNQRLHGNRTVVSIRILPELKEALKRFCKRNGLSICHVFEGLVTGFLKGVQEKIELVNQSPTMTVNVTREVKRVRRYCVEEGCHYCHSPTVGEFQYKPTGEKYPLCRYHSEEFLRQGTWECA